MLERGRREQVFPAASLWVADRHAPLLDIHVGGAGKASVWDLASLTKPMAVVSLAMKLQAQGRLSPDDEVFAMGVSVRDLLAHRGGFPAWWDLPQLLDAGLPGWTPGHPDTRAFVKSALLAGRNPSQTGAVYSDLGYMVLGWFLEDLTGAGLADWVPGYLPAGRRDGPFMSGGTCPFRERELFGEVNDINTFALGGVAGHAGLFGQAEEVGLWALDLARSAAELGGSFQGSIVRDYWKSARFQDGDSWVTGFDTPTPGGSSAGSLISEGAVGHLGFTGTSVWIDPGPGRVVVLLTNRVAAPPAAQQAIKRFRPALHDAVFKVLNRP